MTSFTPTAILLFLVMGAGLGWVGGLLGIGGGIIAIPILAMLFGMSQQMAQGTALVMVTPNVLLAFWRYHQRNPLPRRSIAWLGTVALVATWPAARLAVRLDSRLLMSCFALFLIGLSLYFFWGSRPAARPVDPQAAWSERWLPGVGLLSGFFSGLFSVGAGLVAAPILVRCFGKRQAVAQGIALAVVVPGALLSLAIYGEAQLVDWPTGLLLAVGGMSTVSSGVAWAHRLPERRLRRIFAAMLLLTAGLMIRAGHLG